MTVLDALPRTEPMRRAGPPASRPPVAPRRCRVPLLGGAVEAVYQRRGRWAITDGRAWAAASSAELALSQYLEVVWARRLRPLILGVADRGPYARRGLYTYRYGAQAVVDLTGRRPTTVAAHLRRDVEAADRAGVLVVPCGPAQAAQVARFAPATPRNDPDVEAGVAVRPDGTVLGIAAWTAPGPRDGAGAAGAPAAAVRVLELAAVHPQAPPWVQTALLADAVAEYARRGVPALELGWRPAGPWWPAPGPVLPAAVVPVLARLGPRWRGRWLAIPSGWQLPAAAWALC